MNIEGFDQFELVGSGGFSRVWKAYQPGFGRHVAIKVLSFDIADESAVRSFERECRAMGRVSTHPNIVTVHGNGQTEDGRLYIVMEYLEGGSLEARLEDVRSIKELLAIGVKVAAALASAHQAGILHRDIKPANILVTAYGEPALGDFGISTIDRERTSTGTSGLTVHYAPPEILDGHRADERSDIYSLGATLWALAQGRKPFQSQGDESIAATAVRIMSQPSPTIDRQDCPASLRTLVTRMMAKRRDHRPASALEVAEALQSIQKQLGLPATQIAYQFPKEESGPTELPSAPVEPARSSRPAVPRTGAGQARRSDRAAPGLLRIVLFTALGMAVLVGLALGISSLVGDADTAMSTTAILDSRLTPNSALSVGDCVSSADVGTVSEVAVTSCQELHDLEVFARLDLGAVSAELGADSPFPGEDAVADHAFDECVGQFEQYVGVAYSDSDLFIQTFYPLQASWVAGDRSVTCLLFAWDEQRGEVIPRAESARASP